MTTEQQANKPSLWMTQLGDAASPRRPGSEFETIFTAWRNDSQIFKWNSIRNHPKCCAWEREIQRLYVEGRKISREQHVCKRLEDYRES